nr:toprim domain-containing protein [uncultured Dyadobacter sp.]
MDKGASSEFIDKVRNTDLVSYLSKLGLQPDKVSGINYWYRSPFRQEKTPSFKVNRALNRWYDFGEGKGGSLIDFGIRYRQCSVAEFLHSFKADIVLLPAAQPPIPAQHKQIRESKISVIDVKPLQQPALIAYLGQRAIDLDIARAHCHQVHYQIADNTYYAIGFANDSGGYELRNPYSKISTSPKDITRLGRGAEKTAVFEGFFDFLSYRSLNQQNTDAENYLVLNSVAFFARALPELQTIKRVELYLDQDQAGRLLTSRALAENGHFADKSVLYQNYKDLNQYLVAIQSAAQQRPNPNLGFELSI